MKSLLKHSQSGDTIIEVLISISILALVLAVSYVSTSNSLHQGTNAANRLQALSYAQQQIEVIKNAQQSSPNGAFIKYQSPTAFCINPAIADDPTQQYGSKSPGDSSCASGSTYSLTDTYASGLFTITASWVSSASRSASQLQVFYRIPQ